MLSGVPLLTAKLAQLHGSVDLYVYACGVPVHWRHSVTGAAWCRQLGVVTWQLGVIGGLPSASGAAAEWIASFALLVCSVCPQMWCNCWTLMQYCTVSCWARDFHGACSHLLELGSRACHDVRWPSELLICVTSGKFQHLHVHLHAGNSCCDDH
jgi:hypothetical protein